MRAYMIFTFILLEDVGRKNEKVQRRAQRARKIICLQKVGDVVLIILIR